MSGVNMFIDYDLTRYHTRTGMGVEYWRDYLKLSGNGYLRLSNGVVHRNSTMTMKHVRRTVGSSRGRLVTGLAAAGRQVGL